MVFFADLLDALINVRIVTSLTPVFSISQRSIVVEVDSAAVHDYLRLLGKIIGFGIDGGVSFEASVGHGGLLGREGLASFEADLRVFESGIQSVSVGLIPRKNAVDVKPRLFTGRAGGRKFSPLVYILRGKEPILLLGRGRRGQIPFEPFELFDEAVIGMDNFSPSLDQTVSLTVAHSPVLHQISQDEGNRTRHTRQTMHHDICPLDALMDVACRLMEIPPNIKGLMILSGNVEEVRNFTLRMADLHALCGGQQCPHLQS